MSANATASFGNPAQSQPRAPRKQISTWEDTEQRNSWLACVLSAAALVWAYWMMFLDAAEFWSQPQYSHGWVLPLIALYMMWKLRPNQRINSELEGAIKKVAGTSVALVAIGNTVEGFEYLQGWGLALGCVGGFACVLWNQPFASVTTREESDRSYPVPAVLWVTAGLGMAVASIGIARIGMGPLSPDVFSMLGLLVLIVALVLSSVLAPAAMKLTRNEIILGTLVALFSTGAWYSAVLYDRMPLARTAFVATAIGILLAIGGTRLLRWAGPPVGFLVTMFPLPSLLESRVLSQLQGVAVGCSEIIYTILGIPAIREGNTLSLPGSQGPIPMEIAQACSGLSMTNLLFAMGLAATILVDRPWWDRLVLFLSTLPIAIISNVFRIVLTGLIWMAMDRFVSSDPQYLAELRDPVHSWIGLIVMMPFALGLLFLEWKVLSMLTVSESESRATPAPIR